jgi:hypothetical protein
VKRTLSIALLSLVLVAATAEAARVRVVRRGPAGRTRVTVRTVRPHPVVRVAPRVYLAPVTFGVVAASIPAHRSWNGSETIERADGWTDFTMNIDRRGTKLFIEIDRGAAQLSYAEVVFDNGEAQVVDFNDRVHRTGVYELLDFRNGRKVDHVRVVAKADTKQSLITLHLAQ